VVISPTDEVCNQWVNSAAEFGVQLSRSGSETKDFDGVAVTYQQVINGSDTHRSLCRTHPTVVVFDEVHHCGEGLQWSDSIRRAFECAAFRIALSGTPFRSDDRPIPFVTYEDGVCRPDFTYSYQEAMDDGVCRLAFFPTIDGSAEWLKNGERKKALLTDELCDSDSSARLRTILDPLGEWMTTTILEARKKTDECRRLGHADAAELWTGVDQNHARELARQIEKLTGERPCLVISDDTDAARSIDLFRNGTDKCIVTVKMVSEGVDIPRIRVLVFATNILTEMFFRQFLGRAIRYQEGLDEQSAYAFIPRVATLVEFAMKVIEERIHHLEAIDAEALIREYERTHDGQQPIPRTFPAARFFGGSLPCHRAGRGVLSRRHSTG
jgi:superfamily II DNA or RNA helicase